MLVRLSVVVTRQYTKHLAAILKSRDDMLSAHQTWLAQYIRQDLSIPTRALDLATYRDLKEAWINDALLIKYMFPVCPVTDTEFLFYADVITDRDAVVIAIYKQLGFNVKGM